MLHVWEFYDIFMSTKTAHSSIALLLHSSRGYVNSAAQQNADSSQWNVRKDMKHII